MAWCCAPPTGGTLAAAATEPIDCWWCRCACCVCDPDASRSRPPPPGAVVLCERCVCAFDVAVNTGRLPAPPLPPPTKATAGGAFGLVGAALDERVVMTGADAGGCCCCRMSGPGRTCTCGEPVEPPPLVGAVPRPPGPPSSRAEGAALGAPPDAGAPEGVPAPAGELKP